MKTMAFILVDEKYNRTLELFKTLVKSKPGYT